MEVGIEPLILTVVRFGLRDGAANTFKLMLNITIRNRRKITTGKYFDETMLFPSLCENISSLLHTFTNYIINSLP
jgi:hypothetical protein